MKQLVITEHQLYDWRARLDSQVHTYRKLYELGKSLNQTFDLSASLTLANEFVVYELGFERSLLLLLNPAQTAFEVKGLEGYYDGELMAAVEALSLPCDDPVVCRALVPSDGINRSKPLVYKDHICFGIGSLKPFSRRSFSGFSHLTEPVPQRTFAAIFLTRFLPLSRWVRGRAWGLALAIKLCAIAMAAA